MTSIGFSLLGIGANSFGGGFGNPHFGEAPYMIVGTVTLVSCLVFNIKAKSFYKQLSVLFGLIVGYITAFSTVWWICPRSVLPGSSPCPSLCPMPWNSIRTPFSPYS